jgi:hypothetical protein
MNPYDKYKFYELTDNDKEILRSIMCTCPTYVFIPDDYSFNEFLMDYSTRGHIKDKYSHIEPIVILKICYDVVYPDKFCNYGDFYTYKFSKSYGTGWELKLHEPVNLTENERLILYSKLSYFHELIFHIRKLCEWDLPEDVIKYMFQFITKIDIITT